METQSASSATARTADVPEQLGCPVNPAPGTRSAPCLSPATGHWPHLMKGREMASTVRMNQEGWTMIRDFRFFRSLREAEETRWPRGGGRAAALAPWLWWPARRELWVGGTHVGARGPGRHSQ